jgi:dTDP-4-amino-4,6-dideoxygalactose transaminase
MSDFNAALGLVQLDHFEEVRQARAAVDRRYRELLAGLEGIEVPAIPEGVESNHSYFPILVGPAALVSRDGVYQALKDANIHTRRYFYPLLSGLPMYRDFASAAPANLPVATRVAEQILCLPIYPGLSADDQERIAGIVRSVA